MPRKNIHERMLLFACLIFLGSCYKNKTVILDAPEITRTVSYSQDIITIFNSSCNTSGCHSNGGQAPNLTAAGAYDALIIGNYIDKAVPENSILYQKMSGKRGTPMPVSGSNKNFNALILAWIRQGANNN